MFWLYTSVTQVIWLMTMRSTVVAVKSYLFNIFSNKICWNWRLANESSWMHCIVLLWNTHVLAHTHTNHTLTFTYTCIIQFTSNIYHSIYFKYNLKTKAVVNHRTDMYGKRKALGIKLSIKSILRWNASPWKSIPQNKRKIIYKKYI